MEHRSETFTVDGSVRVQAACDSGSITLRRGPSGSVTVEATIRVPEGTEYSAECDGATVRVTGRCTGFAGFFAAFRAGVWDRPRIEITITAPPDATIEATTSNGPVEADGFNGPVTIRTSNGAVRCSRLSGGLDAGTSNGSVRLEDVVGRTRVRVANGAIMGAKVRGTVQVRSTNGRVELDLDLEPRTDSTVQTTNGSVSVGLAPGRTVDLRVCAVHGRTTVELPRGDVRADSPRLRVQTTNGRVHVYEAPSVPQFV